MTKAVNKDKLIEILEEAITSEELAVFVGAGLSKGAGYFDWKELLRKPAQDLNLDVEEEKHDLVSLAQYYCNQKGRGEIDRVISETFPSSVPINENHDLLAKLPLDVYWTTNYDKLLEKALDKNGKNYVVKSEDQHLHLHNKKYDAVIYKMHGDIENPDKAVFTRDDYEKYGLKERTLFRDVLKGDLLTKTFLFLGFSFTDPNFNSILSKMRILLDGKTRNHYCVMKSVNESDYEDTNEFNYEKIKEGIVIDDLDRFGIKVCLIESYNEITEILEILYSRYKKRRIFISGSAEDYSPLKKDDAKGFISRLAYRLVEKGYHIVNGYGLGIGSYIIDGVTEYCYLQEKRKIADYLTLMPFPLNSDTNEDLRQTWTRYRQDMISDCGIALFMFGNKDDNGQIVQADGMLEEFEIAKEQELDILALKFTGNIAEKICKEYENANQIENFEDVETIVEEIVKQIDLKNKRR